jgi:hypothetical protein
MTSRFMIKLPSELDKVMPYRFVLSILYYDAGHFSVS